MSEATAYLSSARERPAQAARLPGRGAVPWLTVLSLAAVMAYGDGFWMMSLRGAVGSVGRTQGQFAGWLRESTLVLPVFVFAVLGALTLALRWFGPVLKARTFAATMLMVVAAGTLVGVVQVAVNAVYDYQLQSGTLEMMATMRRPGTAALLALQQQQTLSLQVRAVGYGVGILLVTNLVLVALAIALRGGRLDVSTPGADTAGRNRVRDLRLLLAAGLTGGAVIHLAVLPEHLGEWPAAGAFFAVLALAELVIAGLLLVRRHVPNALLAAVVASIGPLALWWYSRTLGLPFGPAAGVPEAVGLADLAAGVLESATLLIAVVLLRGRQSQPRPLMSAHVGWLTLVGVVAITVLGLSATGLVVTGLAATGHG